MKLYCIRAEYSTLLVLSPKFTLSRVQMVTLNGYSVDEESPLKGQKIALLEQQVANLEIAIFQA
jgi:hypothetical protein